MNSSESAEELIKISLQGFEVVARITGAGATYVAGVIFNKLKEKKMSKGKTSLMNMLKSGRELKIFSLQDKEQLKKFHEVAKKYGVLYTAIMPKKSDKDGFIDIMLKAEDAPKVNWIIEKFKLSAVDIASIKSEVEKDKMEEMVKDAKERGVEVKTYEEQLAEDLLSKPIQKEENEASNPQMATTEKSPLSEPSSENKKDSGVVASKKPSVRETLKEIKEEKQNESSKEVDTLDKNNNDKLNKDIAPKENNKSNKQKSKKRKER